MIEFISLSIVIILTFLTGHIFRKQYRQNTMSNCLIMLVVMTMSTTVGVIVATWLPEMVLSTILSIMISVALTFVLTFKLPFYLMIEGFTMLLMGSMMGAMLRIMTVNYALLSIVFFTILYIFSTLLAIRLWNTKDYPKFRKAVPFYYLGVATLAVGVLIGTSFLEMLHANPTSEFLTEHHH